jgi:hypothetical protein
MMSSVPCVIKRLISFHVSFVNKSNSYQIQSLDYQYFFSWLEEDLCPYKTTGPVTLGFNMESKKIRFQGCVWFGIKFQGVKFFLDSRKFHPSESALCRFRWASKTLTIPDSYKRYMSWLELKIYYKNFRYFTIMLQSLKTRS